MFDFCFFVSQKSHVNRNFEVKAIISGNITQLTKLFAFCNFKQISLLKNMHCHYFFLCLFLRLKFLIFGSLAPFFGYLTRFADYAFLNNFWKKLNKPQVPFIVHPRTILLLYHKKPYLRKGKVLMLFLFCTTIDWVIYFCCFNVVLYHCLTLLLASCLLF